MDSSDLLGLLSHWTGAMEPGTGEATYDLGDCDADADIDSADLMNVLNQ